MVRIVVLVLLLMFGCGSIDAIPDTGYGDGSVDGVLGQDASGDSDILGGFDRRDIVDEPRLTEPSPLSCVWDPNPWAVMPCADGMHAVCCYTRPDGSCDGRKDGCWEGGKECVLTCP